MPTYTGLKDFARGMQELYRRHGNIPVFLEVGKDEVAPFGIVVQSSELLNGEAIILKGGASGRPSLFPEGECTE